MNFQQFRTNMVTQQVQPWSVFNERVLTVLSQLPRETFVPPAFVNLAYSDTDIPLLEGQTMLSPKVVGRALEVLQLTGNEKVLEIGTGTGYMTACLSKLCASVTSIEINATLLSQAEKNLSAVNCKNVTLELGNGILGWESMAPFDVIVVTGSYPMGVPQVVCEQLLPGGRLFCFCNNAPTMHALLIERHDQQYQSKILFETVVPALIHAPVPQKFEF